MSGVLIDSNVLLDLMTEDESWFAWSSAAVERLANASRLIINAVVYAEVSVRFSRAEALDAVLPGEVFEREAIPFAAAFLAGNASRPTVVAAGPSRRRFQIFLRSPRCCRRLSLADAGYRALPGFLSQAGPDRAGVRASQVGDGLPYAPFLSCPTD